MDNFKRGGGGFRKSFGGGDRRGGFGGKPRFNDDRPKQMYQAICSECSKACEVPFRPTGERPVYCRDCFAREGRNAGADFRDHRPRNDFSHKKHPGPKGVFRAPHVAAASSSQTGGFMKEIEAINSKLDRLLGLLESQSKAAALTDAVKKAAPKKKANSKKK